MANKILDIRHTIDEQVSKEGLKVSEDTYTKEEIDEILTGKLDKARSVGVSIPAGSTILQGLVSFINSIDMSKITDRSKVCYWGSVFMGYSWRNASTTFVFSTTRILANHEIFIQQVTLDFATPSNSKMEYVQNGTYHDITNDTLTNGASIYFNY